MNKEFEIGKKKRYWQYIRNEKGSTHSIWWKKREETKLSTRYLFFYSNGGMKTWLIETGRKYRSDDVTNFPLCIKIDLAGKAFCRKAVTNQHRKWIRKRHKFRVFAQARSSEFFKVAFEKIYFPSFVF